MLHGLMRPGMLNGFAFLFDRIYKTSRWRKVRILISIKHLALYPLNVSGAKLIQIVLDGSMVTWVEN